MRENKLRDEHRIDLSRNENPISPSNGFFDTHLEVNRYPIVHHDLIEALAKKHDVDPNMIVVGNGSTEILDTICRTFLNDKSFILCDKFLYPPTKQSIRRQGAIIYPNSQKETSDIFLVNPCCVTGRVYNPHEIEVRLNTGKVGKERQPIVVVDEAYIDYHPGRISFINSGANIRSIVTRTFSKMYGLAGLRIGYAVCSRISDAFDIQKVQPAYNLSSFSAEAAIIMLNDDQYQFNTISNNNKSHEIMMHQLDKLGVHRMEPAGNFICAKVPEVEGFLTRELLYEDMSDWKRITLSTPEVMMNYITQLEKELSSHED